MVFSPWVLEIDRPNAPHMLEGFCHCFLYAMAATPALLPICRVLLYLLFAGNDCGISVIASTCTDPAVTPNIRATTAPSMASHKPLWVRLRKEHMPWPLSEIFTDTLWGGQESTGVVIGFGRKSLMRQTLSVNRFYKFLDRFNVFVFAWIHNVVYDFFYIYVWV